MLSPDDMTQTTGALEQESRSTGRRTLLSERRQNILQHKQTDALPALSLGTESPNARVAWRQVTQLREENRHLRFELETIKSEMQKLAGEYSTLQAEFDKEVDTIHNSHRQEMTQYQQHLRELMEERNQLMEAHMEVEQRYQGLYHSFQASVDDEVHKAVGATTQALEFAPDTPTPFSLDGIDTMKTVDLQAHQREDDHLLEALYLKREIGRMAEQLQEERRHMDVERANFLKMQSRAREQLKTEQKLQKERLRTQWSGAITLTTTSCVLFLVFLQLGAMALFHFTLNISLIAALVIPIVICAILTVVLAKPLSLVKDLHNSVPHRVKGKAKK